MIKIKQKLTKNTTPHDQEDKMGVHNALSPSRALDHKGVVRRGDSQGCYCTRWLRPPFSARAEVLQEEGKPVSEVCLGCACLAS